MSVSESTSPTHHPLRRRWAVLIPAVLLVYIVAYIDRVNISFAVAHLQEEMAINSAQAGFAAGVFFIGYIILQIPGGYLAQRWSAKKLLVILILLWGICSTSVGFVQSYSQLVTLRFLLGLIEGAVQPALMVLLTRWFPARERGRAFSLFILHNPIAVIIAAPLSGLILTHGGWRELFIIEGVAGLLLALTVWIVIGADSPSRAWWLSDAERHEIEDLRSADPVIEKKSDASAAVRSSAVWILAVASLFVWLGFYGLQLWLPSLLRSSFSGDLTIGLVSAIPPICAAVAILVNGRGADRDGRYALRVAVPLLIGGVILILSTFVTAEHRVLIVAALALATACQLSFFGPFWSLASQRVPVVAVGVGYGIINGLGNLGGLIGPYLGGWLRDATDSLRASSFFFGCSVIFAGLLVGIVFSRRRTPAAEPDAQSAKV